MSQNPGVVGKVSDADLRKVPLRDRLHRFCVRKSAPTEPEPVSGPLIYEWKNAPDDIINAAIQFAAAGGVYNSLNRTTSFVILKMRNVAPGTGAEGLPVTYEGVEINGSNLLTFRLRRNGQKTNLRLTPTDLSK